MGGKGSGRKPYISSKIGKERLIENQNMIVDQALLLASQGDKDTIHLLVQMLYGRPSLSVDQRVKGEVNFSVDDMWTRIMDARQQQQEIIDAEVKALPTRKE